MRNSSSQTEPQDKEEAKLSHYETKVEKPQPLKPLNLHQGSQIIPRYNITIDNQTKMAELTKKGLNSLIRMEIVCHLKKINEEKNIQPLVQVLEQNNTLSCLILAIHNCDDQRLKTLSRVFLALTYLSTLKLKFLYSKTISDEGLRDLGLYLNKLRILDDLSLSFHTQNITCKGIEKLFSSLCTQKSLKKFRLLLTDFRKFDEKDVEKIFYNLRKLSFLSSLRLNVDFCSRLSDEACRILSTSLSKFKLLSTLELIFYCNEVPSENGLEIIFNMLSELKLLVDLTLHLPARIPYTDEIINCLSSTVKRMQGLRALNLIIHEGRRVTAQGIKTLFSVFPKLQRLSSLTISLTQFQFNQDGFSSFTSCLKDLRLLRVLKLGFSNCKTFGDAELSTITDILKGYPNLSVLYLSFGNCGDFLSQTKKDFYIKLSHVKNIELHTFTCR